MAKDNQPSTDRRIIAVAEQWVFMGMWNPPKDGVPGYLTDASCIRGWGTTQGLGEIALRGPTPETTLDPYGVVVVENPQAVLFHLKCTW